MKFWNCFLLWKVGFFHMFEDGEIVQLHNSPAINKLVYGKLSDWVKAERFKAFNYSFTYLFSFFNEHLFLSLWGFCQFGFQCRNKGLLYENRRAFTNLDLIQLQDVACHHLIAYLTSHLIRLELIHNIFHALGRNELFKTNQYPKVFFDCLA